MSIYMSGAKAKDQNYDLVLNEMITWTLTFQISSTLAVIVTIIAKVMKSSDVVRTMCRVGNNYLLMK